MGQKTNLKVMNFEKKNDYNGREMVDRNGRDMRKEVGVKKSAWINKHI